MAIKEWYERRWHDCECCGWKCDDGMNTVCGWVCQRCIDRLDGLVPGWHLMARADLAAVLEKARKRLR